MSVTNKFRNNIKTIFTIFSRTTSNNKFIPEIDGLRFFAISSVVLFHIFNHYFLKGGAVVPEGHKVTSFFVHAVSTNFNRGVELFFAISGFILALPFATSHIKTTPRPNLKKYFWRRVTRLEPPYVLSLIIFFLLNYVTHHNTLSELFPHFFASFFYVHNFIYPGTLPLINGVTWSLEIEIQFYILAPLLTSVFMIRNKVNRRLLILLLILISITVNAYLSLNFLSIINYFHFFFIGFLMTDLYLEGNVISMNKIKGLAHGAIGAVALFTLFFFPEGDKLSKFVLPLCIGLFFYVCMFSRPWKTISSFKLLTVIGGMCYSIYLLHVYIIAFVDKLSITQHLPGEFYSKFFMHIIICLIAILIISGIYFLAIERPCMDKDWVKKLMNRLRGSRVTATG